MKEFLRRHYQNHKGWKTREKLLVIQSDDWGSLRTTDRGALEDLQKLGVDTNLCHYMMYDSIASDEDLTMLFDVLNRVKDAHGRPAVITPNVLVSNPDFEQIQQSNFRTYASVDLPTTFNRLRASGKDREQTHKKGLDLWKEGVDAGIFMPQLHGNEHVNVMRWLAALQEGNEVLHTAFRWNMWGVSQKTTNAINQSVQAALDYNVAGGEYIERHSTTKGQFEHHSNQRNEADHRDPAIHRDPTIHREMTTHREKAIHQETTTKSEISHPPKAITPSYTKAFILDRLQQAEQRFRDTFGYTSQSFIAPNYTWFGEVEEALYRNGVKFMQSGPVQWELSMRGDEDSGGTGIERVDAVQFATRRHHNGYKSPSGMIYMVRNVDFEPTEVRHNAGLHANQGKNPGTNLETNPRSNHSTPQSKALAHHINSTLKNIETAFQWGRPAIISTHRVNYISAHSRQNRDENLILLRELLQSICKRWPDVQFVSTEELGDRMLRQGV